MNYLFIAEKPESSDYCRGCHMADYYSDFVVCSELEEDALIAVWSYYMFRNLNLSVNEKGYEFKVFHDGHPCSWSSDYDHDNNVQKSFEEAALKAQQLLKEFKEKEAADKEKEKLEADAKNLELQRSLFESLSKKFGNS